jgi:large subunit ribosomal protein L23
MGFFDRFKKSKEKQVSGKKTAGKIIRQEKQKKDTAKKALPKKESKPKVFGKETLDTGLAYRNLIKPMVSEKASVLASEGKYVFVVSPSANKIEVKKAVQKVFNVKVKDVNIINVSGKSVRFGRHWGRTKDWKKAVVTLEPGENIELYEGV